MQKVGWVGGICNWFSHRVEDRLQICWWKDHISSVNRSACYLHSWIDVRTTHRIQLRHIIPVFHGRTHELAS